MADRTRRVSARVTEEEWQAIADYCAAVDNIHIADFVRHAVFGHMRRDKRRVDRKYWDTLKIEG